MMENILWGNTIEKWLISLIIIVVTFLIMKLLSLIGRKIIKPFIQKTSNHYDDMVYDSLGSPVLFGIILFGIWIAFQQLTFPDNIVKAVNGAYRFLIVLNITWCCARFVNTLLDEWGEKTSRKKGAQKPSVRMLPIFRRFILAVVWLLGIVMGLSNIGINIAALWGTLGIGGIAFALASQDTVKNIFGAFTILTDRPFSLGDIVKIDNFEGTIIDIGVRSTRMRNYDKRIITFPNYKIADASIVNISAEPMRRVTMKLGLTYDTTPAKMQEALEILRNTSVKVPFVSSKDLVAHFLEFGDSALGITFVYYIEKKGNIKDVTSAVNMEILTAFNEAGLNFAFPSQTVYLEKA